MLPALLAKLARQQPEIQIELVASNALDNLLEREADIAVRMVRPTQGTLIARHLADWALGFYARRELLAGQPPVTRDNLLQQRWIGLDQSMRMIEGFRAGGFDVDRRLFSFRCDDQIVGYEAMRAGVGIGVTIVQLAERQPELLRLRVVFDFLADELTAWGAGAALAAPRRRPPTSRRRAPAR